jgi:hypothetical protein
MAIIKESARVQDYLGDCKINNLRLCTFFQHDQQNLRNEVNSLIVNKQAPNKRAMNFGQFVEGATSNKALEIQKVRYGKVSSCQLGCHVKN